MSFTGTHCGTGQLCSHRCPAPATPGLRDSPRWDPGPVPPPPGRQPGPHLPGSPHHPSEAAMLRTLPPRWPPQPPGPHLDDLPLFKGQLLFCSIGIRGHAERVIIKQGHEDPGHGLLGTGVSLRLFVEIWGQPVSAVFIWEHETKDTVLGHSCRARAAQTITRFCEQGGGRRKTLQHWSLF